MNKLLAIGKWHLADSTGLTVNFQILGIETNINNNYDALFQFIHYIIIGFDSISLINKMSVVLHSTAVA